MSSPTREPRKRESSVPDKAPRRRLRAEDARKRILDAAERQLMKVGPEGLRLTDLARTLGVSHPAILHHFGSREGLVAAVVRHAVDTLNAQLIDVFTKGGTTREAVMDMVADVYGARGSARLLAWLLLSGRTGKGTRGGGGDQPLARLAQTLHALHTSKSPDARYEDTLFELQLVAIALLGDAIFGDTVRRATGLTPTPAAARDFRVRLAKLLGDARP